MDHGTFTKNMYVLVFGTVAGTAVLFNIKQGSKAAKPSTIPHALHNAMSAQHIDVNNKPANS